MFLTLHFILSHLIADYSVQPSKLVEYKYKSFFGVLLHTLMHLGIVLILVLPFLYLNTVRIGVLIIFVTHTLIDYLKITIEKKYPENKFVTYVSDQIVHLIIILLLVRFIGRVEPDSSWGWAKIYLNSDLINFLIILHLSTYFWDITRWAYINSKNPTPYKRDYRMMARNALIVAIAFAAYYIAR
jgi:hypothetical protein